MDSIRRRRLGDTPLDRVVAARAAARARIARERVLSLVDALAGAPVEIGVIGSLARGRFGPDSDVDLLVRGPVDTATRVRVEQAVAAAMRGSGIRADVVYACDLMPERLKEFEHDLVEPSRLREARAEAGANAVLTTPGPT